MIYLLRLPVGPSLSGMTLARPVLDYQSHVLLAAGVVLTPRYLRRLQDLGYREVWVEHPLSDGASEPEPLEETTKRQAMDTVRAAMRAAAGGRDLPLPRIYSLVDQIAQDVAAHPQLLTSLTMLKGADNYTFLHSANVCALSMLLGGWLGMRGQLLRDLGVGTLLHDLGKAFIPSSLLLKAAPLSAVELTTMRSHAQLGCQVLQQLKGLSSRVPLAACEHHERLDGSGYPHGLKGEDISLPGRICAVADSYDAMTSQRPYRRGKLPHRACEELAAQAGSLYEPHVVETFLAHVAVYPVGSFLRLAGGLLGVCVRQGEDSLHPVVRLMAPGERHPGKEPTEAVANATPETVVLAVLEPEEVAHLLAGTGAAD